MTSPAVVILTEPTHCELADADTLVQALLQAQQLSQAGVPVSQAFCDHPAEAMKFIDAYAKAYPELQLQSSDLPVPEHLYSMLADGRLNALQAPDSRPDATKLEDASRLQPLFVLSLGAPEILMQALRDKGFANKDIQVVEIAPVENLDSDRLSVSEAVAVRTVAGPSWLAERTAESRAEDQELLPLGESGNAPLKLESVELDLDRIEIHEAKDQIPAPPAVVDTARVIRAKEDAGANRPVQGKAPASDEPAAKDTTVVPPAPAASEPASESRDTARTEAA
jgi:hypothetical protein